MNKGEGPSAGFLGTGWGFPPSFGPGGVGIELVSGVEDIHQSLQILFATRRGERAMRHDFGCNLDELLFEELDHALLGKLKDLIRDAVLEHEPRIQLLEVDASPDPQEQGLLTIVLDYAVRGTNSRYNMVFPFYLNEARTPGL